jgi:hypothetical protein
VAVVDLDDKVMIRSGIVDILLAISKGTPTPEQMKRARESVVAAAQILTDEWKSE